MSTAVVLQSMIVIFILILVGLFLTKAGVIKAEGAKMMSFIVLKVCAPLLLISSVLKDDLDIPLRSIGIGFLLIAILYALVILLGIFMPKLFRIPKNQQRFYHIMTVYGNVGLIGIPVISYIVGEQALVYVTMVSIASNVLFYTHGHYVLLKDTGVEGNKFHPKSLINIGSIGGVLAIVIVCFRLRFPSMIESVISYCGNATTFLAMLTLGFSLSKMALKKIFSSPRMIIYFLVRMIAFPIAVALVLPHVTSYTMMIQALVIQMGMPAGNYGLMLATEKGLDTDVLTQGTMLTTILSIATITIISLAL